MNTPRADWQLVERVAPDCRGWFAEQAEANAFPTRAQFSQEDAVDEVVLAQMRRNYIDDFRNEHAGEVEDWLDEEFKRGFSDLNHKAPLVKKEFAHREIEPFLWRDMSEDEAVWTHSRSLRRHGQFFVTLIGIEFDLSQASKLGIRVSEEPEKSGAPKSIGRPRGSGAHQEADRAIAKTIADEMKQRGETTFAPAIRRHLDDISGVSDESKIRRLTPYVRSELADGD